MLSILEIPGIRRQARPIDLRTYHWMGAQGLVDQRTELLRGVIVEKMSKSPLHEYVISILLRMAREIVQENQLVRKEGPLTLADSEPEPDIAIVEGVERDFRHQHPTTARLVIEVAVSSTEVDREKAAIYAEAGIPEFWLVIPEKGALEIHTAPLDGLYTERRVLGSGETAVAGEFPALSVALDELFR